MARRTYEIGQKVYYKATGDFAGEVLGVNEVYWSGDEYSLVTYYVRSKEGSTRRIISHDLKELPIEKN